MIELRPISNRLSCGLSDPLGICNNADNCCIGKCLEWLASVVGHEHAIFLLALLFTADVAFLNSPRHLTFWSVSSSQVSCGMPVLFIYLLISFLNFNSSAPELKFFYILNMTAKLLNCNDYFYYLLLFFLIHTNV